MTWSDLEGLRYTLADFVTVKGVYPAGRLDYDSEGLLLLTDDGALQQCIADPRHRAKETYLAPPTTPALLRGPSSGRRGTPREPVTESKLG